MPYIIVKKEKGAQADQAEWCLFKHDAEHKPVGETLGCHPSEAEAQDQMAALYASEGKSANASTDTLVAYGGAVKALGNGKIGGYLVEFTSPDDLDLDGEYFDAKTNFDLDDDPRSRVYYQHGMDGTLKRRVLGSGALKQDAVGIWIESQLKLRDEWERAVYMLAERGKMSWSSGTGSHLVERERVGKGVHIVSWPLGLDASLTPTPSNPRPAARAIALKSFPVASFSLQDLASQVAGSQPVTEQVTAPDATKTNSVPGHVQSEVTAMGNEATNVTPVANVVTMTPEELSALVGTAVKTGVMEAMKALPAQHEAVAADARMTDLEAEKPFKSLGEQLVCIVNATKGLGTDKRLYGINEKYTKQLGLNETVGSEGGFLLQPEYSTRFLERTYTTGQVANRVTRTPLGSGSNELIVQGLDEVSRADGARWGGVQSYWGCEAGTKAATMPRFRLIDLKLKKLYALYYATDELLQDALALEARVSRFMSLEIQFRTEDAFVNGVGGGFPLGILQAPCLITVPAQPAQAVDTIVSQNVMNMWARLWSGSYGSAAWFISQDCYPQLMSMAVAVGAGGVPVWLPANGLSSSPYSTLMGLPVIPIEYCPVLGNVGDIILADWSAYETIDKGGIQAASSIHVQFLTDQTCFRFVFRVDGRPSWNSALTPRNGGATVGPFIALAAR